MPIAVVERFPDGAEVEATTVPNGFDISVPVTLVDGTRRLIVAVASVESKLAYVIGVNFVDHFPDPDELADICNDPRNFDAVMIPGDTHTILLQEEEYDAPSALIIKHLGSGPMEELF
jgi:hypothetical protein